MWNFKVVAGADLWVYNADNLCVSFFNQVASIFHLGGGKKKIVPAYYARVILREPFIYVLAEFVR